MSSEVDEWREALAATPPGDPERAYNLSNLGTALWTRFTVTGEPDDLYEAIDCGRLAAAAAQPGDPARPAMLCNLGVALLTRFELEDVESDLKSAIATLREALAAGGPPRAGPVTKQ
jgi:hypothetical protein